MSKMIEVKNLKKHFEIKRGFKKSKLKAVDGVSFHIDKGETFGLVGESGCGKSTVGRAITTLFKATSGEILIEGTDISKMSPTELKPYRKKIQSIFQDPYASLNPYMTIEEIVSESLEEQGNLDKEERRKKIIATLEKVGLNEEVLNRYPHEFSGGQRQRIGIARAIIVEPEFIFCDEPISALDVSIQAQVINTIYDIQKEMNLTLLFVAHDLAMVRHISDRIGVMYLGHLVEVSKSDDLYEEPLHPYTKTLLSSIPILNPRLRDRERLLAEGELLSQVNPPKCCLFHTRCPYSNDLCKNTIPLMEEVKKGHFVACHKVKKSN